MTQDAPLAQLESSSLSKGTTTSVLFVKRVNFHKPVQQNAHCAYQGHSTMKRVQALVSLVPRPTLRETECPGCGPGQEFVSPGGCQSCHAGKFKPDSGTDSCADCGEGKYQDNTGQTECKSCGDNAVSTPGSDHPDKCKCQSGFVKINGACVSCDDRDQGGNCLCGAGRGVVVEAGVKICKACEIGKYSESLSSGPCNDCGSLFGKTTLQTA